MKPLTTSIEKLKDRLENKLLRTAWSIQERRFDRNFPAGYGRMKIAEMIPEGAECVELGVAAGYFSDAILTLSAAKCLYSIDAWGDHHNDREYVRCVQRLARHGTRSVVIRQFFEDARNFFSDEALDFIYIDAYAHTGQNNGQILDDWWPKLKKGGIYAGHDYDEAWPKTVDAVNNFATKVSGTIEVIEGIDDTNKQDSYGSWVIYK